MMGETGRQKRPVEYRPTVRSGEPENLSITVPLTVHDGPSAAFRLGRASVRFDRADLVLLLALCDQKRARLDAEADR